MRGTQSKRGWTLLLAGASLLSVSLLLAFISLPGAAPAAAQSEPAYDLSWHSMDGGGMMSSTGGSYSLSGSIGQPDAGQLTGGTYTLAGGFWHELVQVIKYIISLPLVLRIY